MCRDCLICTVTVLYVPCSRRAWTPWSTSASSPSSRFPHPTPYTLHHTPYTLHPTPHTSHLHPATFTLHPASQTVTLSLTPVHLPAHRNPMQERLVCYCRTTSTAPCANYCTPCQPLLRDFSGCIRSPPAPMQPFTDADMLVMGWVQWRVRYSNALCPATP